MIVFVTIKQKIAMLAANFKSRLTVSLLLLYFLVVTVHALGGENGTFVHHRGKRALPLALSTERIQLLEDALGWMTFRKNGRLMTKDELAPLFLDTLKQHYISSKFFRTFVIAFRHGVLPRLTLNESEACDPGDTLQYKDSFNSSVTWHFQKEFTFTHYKYRWSNDDKFCDYRQGLICKPATRKCECPEGSKMQPISPGNPVKRCLLEENEICALIDIDHGDDPKHTALAENLHQIIFNLEKPVSCKDGTQCRFKSPDITFPRCYNVNSGPWAPPYVDKFGNVLDSWTLDFGEECVLGLYASPGSCKRSRWSSGIIGLLKGYTCFNFGPPRSQRSNAAAVTESRTGFCAHDYGPYGISNSFFSGDYLPSYLPLFSPFVTPRTVPLRGRDLEQFFHKYLKIYQAFHISGDFAIHAEGEGARCSVNRTERWEQSWSFYASLENDPPAGQDYVPQATKANLYANLEPIIQMTKDVSKKICQIYKTFARYGSGFEPDRDRGFWEPSFKCVAEDPPDSDGNDGTCQKPGKLDTTASDERFKKFQKHLQIGEKGLAEQETRYDRGILEDHPDGLCLPALGPAPKERSLGEVLEGGYCQDGFLCYKDYSDTKNKYDRYCYLRTEEEYLGYVCHASGDEIQYSKCETTWQDKLLSRELEKIGNYTTLNRGDKCAYNFERSIRSKVVDEPLKINKYKILSWLERTMLPGASEGGLCDRTKLLECKDTGICECLENTLPRMVTVGGMMYQSDFCYIANGSCNTDPTELNLQHIPDEWQWRLNPSRLTELEKQKILEFYAYEDPGYPCEFKNLCVYLNTVKQECTEENTGKTGFALKPDPTTTTPKPAPPKLVITEVPKGAGANLRRNERLPGYLSIVMLILHFKIDVMLIPHMLKIYR